MNIMLFQWGLRIQSVTLCFSCIFGFFDVGKHIFQFLLSNKQHLQSFFLDQSVNKSFCWLVFSKIDLLKGYHQVPVAEEEKEIIKKLASKLTSKQVD